MATNAELQAELDKLKAELARKNQITFKVGEKGGVSVYGLNARFPVTLYAEQWERLFTAIPALQAFINDHRSQLSHKN